MKRHTAKVLTIAGTVLVCSALHPSTAPAACDQLLPNLRALPASDIHLVLDAAGDPVSLRFAATNWNSGWGRLEVNAKNVDTSTRKQRVDQRVYDTCGEFVDINAGAFDWHENHNHFHFEGFANYFLTPLGTGGQGRNGSKTTFCIMDTTSINPQIWGASTQLYSTCGNTVQGMSVGWGDTYGSQLSGQSIDAKQLEPGDYALEINVDPFNKIKETNDADNWSCVVLRFVGSPYATAFNILQRRPGRCDDPEEPLSIASITPNQAPAGWTGTVTITGTGFDPVMPVSISSSSATVSVSNVAYIASNTIQASVKVPRKKRLQDRELDVKVGSSFSYTGTAILHNAFTISAP